MAIKGDEIPLCARILSVADKFDMLTNKNSNSTQLDYEMALSEIEANASTQFDPAIVQALKSSLTDAGMISE